MRFAEGDPVSGPLTHPRHHVVYKPGGNFEVDQLIGHGEVGYAKSINRIAELGPGATLEYAFGSRQYLDYGRSEGSFPFHADGSPLGDGRIHTPQDWRSEIPDSDRIQVARLEVVRADHPSISIVLGLGGESVFIGQQLSEDSGITHLRSISVGSAMPFPPTAEPLLPAELTKPENLAVVVRQERVGPTVSHRVNDPGRLVLGLIDPNARRGGTPLEVRQVENTLGIEVDEVLDSVRGGLRIYNQSVRIHASEYRPKMAVTCIDPTYEGNFPANFRAVLVALQAKQIKHT